MACQSENHDVPVDCWGEEWVCPSCNKTFCCAEGGDEEGEGERGVCDTCWYEVQIKKDSDG